MKKKKSVKSWYGEYLIKDILEYVFEEDEVPKRVRTLYETFDSLWSIVEAPEAEISRLDGFNEESARLLNSIGRVALLYLEDKNKDIKRVYDTKSACEILLPKFLGRKREVVVLMLLDGRGHVLYTDIVNEGSFSEVPIYIRRVVELCLKYDAFTAILAHNHPSGNPVPSKNDINSTRDLTFALNGIDVILMDHIIFAGNDYMSMHSSEFLDALKKEVESYKETLANQSKEQEDALFSDIVSRKDKSYGF